MLQMTVGDIILRNKRQVSIVAVTSVLVNNLFTCCYGAGHLTGMQVTCLASFRETILSIVSGLCPIFIMMWIHFAGTAQEGGFD